MSGRFAVVKNTEAFEQALKLCKGSYQVNLLRGIEAISGSTLRGTARKYGYSYKQSANNLLTRCQIAGIPITEIRGDHNRRTLVIG